MPSATSLGLPNIRGRIPLLAGLAIDSFGGGCAGPLLLLYFVRVADVPLGTAGTLLTAATLFSIAAPALVGAVSDQVGSRNLVVRAQFAQGLAFAGFFFCRSLWLLFLCALVASFGQRVFWSSIFKLLSDVADDGDRDRWFGLGGMMQSAGWGLGALAAGGLLAAGGDTPFLIAMALNTMTFFIAGLLMLRSQPSHHRGTANDSGPAPLLRKDKQFLVLIGANTLLALCALLMDVGLPMYVAEALAVSKWWVGVLLAAVCLVLVTGQTLVVRHTAKRRRVNVLIVAGMTWALWGTLMASLLHIPTALVVPGLVLATVVFASADVLHAATSNALAATLAPAAGHGRYLSYWQYSFTFASVIAPGFFAQLFEIHEELPWLAASALALLAVIAIFAVAHSIPHSNSQRH